MTMRQKSLAIESIVAASSTQARAEIDADVVAEYVEAEESGATLPPVDVFFDGNVFYLADGFHRFKAKKKRKQTRIECIVHQGSARDAKVFAACSNQQHGLRRTNADKRRAVEMLLGDSEWAGKSDNEIGEACGVNHETVGSARKALAKSASDEPRTGRDGRKQKASSAKRSAAQKQRHAKNGAAAVKEFDPDEHDAPEDEPEEAPAPTKAEPNIIGQITALLDNQPQYVLIAVRDWINERLK